MSPIRSLLVAFAFALVTITAGCHSDPLGMQCAAGVDPYSIDACPFGTHCIQNDNSPLAAGVCTRICGNSVPDPHDFSCGDGNACMTTLADFGVEGKAVVRLCYNECDGRSCDIGNPTIAADGTCVCVPEPLQLYHGGF